MPKVEQHFLVDDIDLVPDWRKEWLDMPEYVRQEEYVYQKITVSFKTKKDVEKFAQLLNRRITERTDSMWFPEYVTPTGVYVDES